MDFNLLSHHKTKINGMKSSTNPSQFFLLTPETTYPVGIGLVVNIIKPNIKQTKRMIDTTTLKGVLGPEYLLIFQ
jgi:hypothetical protein